MTAVATSITETQLAANNGSNGAPMWIAIDGRVLNVTKFHNLHPGGSRIVTELAGKDVTATFHSLHRQEVLEKWGDRLHVGWLEGHDPDDDRVATLGEVSEVPYAEHPAWQGFESPYHKESHVTLREKVRQWCWDELHLTGLAEDCEADGSKVPDELFRKMGDEGILAARLGPGEHMDVWAKAVKKDLNAEVFGVPVGEFDYFHEQIIHEEFARIGCGGFVAGCGDGHCIGCPPVKQFGPPWMQETVLPAVLSGEKRICLAISEPQAGSDVANIVTTARKTADGKHYIVNGTKKWITGGHFSDYFVVCVRTGDAGMGGISVLLLERGMDGLRTKPIKTSYSASAGTALVIMEDVLVPAENLIGMENQGFLCVMYNFNHERWFIVAYILASTRAMIEECFKWCMQRRAFGKKLMDQGVVRFKMAQMIAALEPCSHWLDSITHQMNNMDYDMQAIRLAGTTSLLKYQSTRVAHLVADNSVQLFGGRGITKDGMGRYAERFNVGNKFAAILGGSEEIMADLGMKMAMRNYPQNAKL